jgi:hypothetical protein
MQHPVMLTQMAATCPFWFTPVFKTTTTYTLQQPAALQQLVGKSMGLGHVANLNNNKRLNQFAPNNIQSQ